MPLSPVASLGSHPPEEEILIVDLPPHHPLPHATCPELYFHDAEDIVTFLQSLVRRSFFLSSSLLSFRFQWRKSFFFPFFMVPYP